VEHSLKVLAEKFNNDKVKIDETVFNPSRIIKVPGTMACKGGNLPDRPHRISKLLTDGKNWDAVPRPLLEVLAAEYVGPPKPEIKTALKLPDLDRREARARAYVSKMDPSKDGNYGHKQLFKVAMVLARISHPMY
jgi:hypothetical protein